MYTCFTELVQKIFKCGDVRNAVLHRTNNCLSMSSRTELLKWFSFDTIIVVVVVVVYYVIMFLNPEKYCSVLGISCHCGVLQCSS